MEEKKRSKYIKLFVLIVASMVLLFLGLVVGYNIFKPKKTFNMPMTLAQVQAAEPQTQETVEYQTVSAQPPQANIAKITPTTNMVYTYLYKQDGNKETTEEFPPYFLIGLTEEELSDTFSGWDILKFSEEEILMQKTVEGKSNQYYVIGIENGYVAVFYETPINGERLKEVTDTPIDALSNDELRRLKAGVYVSGNEQLYLALQDYCS